VNGTPTTTTCPGPEPLAAFAERKLSGEQARAIERHVARCERCFSTYREMLEFACVDVPVPVALAPAPEPPRLRHPVWLAAAAAAVILFTATVWIAVRDRSAGPLADLVAAVGERRLVEPRLSGGFAYGALASPTRGGELDRTDPQNWKIFEAAAKANERARDPQATADDRRALALAHLVLQDADGAIDQLERMLASAPEDARLLNDLAAAHVVRADREDRPLDRAKAIDLASRAVERDPTLLEARFNLALALEKLETAGRREGEPGAAPRAVAAWRDYLTRDSTSPWALEAKERLTRLEARMSDARVRGDPSGAWTELVESLLPHWIGSAPPERAARLGAAIDLADTLDRTTGGSSGGAVVASMRDGSAARWATGVEQYRSGRQEYERGRMVVAARSFAAAFTALDAAKSPLAAHALLYVAITDYYAGKLDLAEARLEQVGLSVAALGDPLLQGRVRWMQGLIRGVRGDFGTSLLRYREALKAFEHAGDHGSAASLHFLLAEALDLLGDAEEAWAHRARSLDLAHLASEGLKASIASDVARAALTRELPWAARALFDPALDAQDAPSSWIESELMSAQIESRLGDTEAARNLLRQARARLGQIDDRDLEARYAAELDLAEGETQGNAERLVTALAYFESANAGARLPELHLALGRALERQDKAEEARAHYERGVRALERAGSSVTEETRRVGLLSESAGLFDAAERLEAETFERPDAAFALAERARAVELAYPGPQAAPSALAQRIPADCAVLYFATLEDRLLRWVIVDQRVRFLPSVIAETALARSVATFESAIARRDDVETRRAAAELYEILVRPTEDALPESGTLWVVPDGPIHHVPFAALYDERSGKYLVERFAVVVAPSAALLGPERQPSAGPERALVLGDPSFDRTLFPQLEDLPAAEREAKTIAALHYGAVLLTGAAATGPRFLDEIERASLVHYAGHAIANERFPLFSGLILAPGRDGSHSGLVQGFELRRMHLRADAIVVLAACRSARDPARGATGTSSLAGALLAAGAREVVGSLWSVEDRESAALLLRLHQALEEQGSAIAALRQAQLAGLADGESPRAWGAYQVIGRIQVRTNREGTS
jgi:CHAT domain-containing protein